MAERWREIAGPVGRIEPGPRNAITDVPGVLVGHAQAASGQRTGVTVVAPPSLPAPAGVATVNGTGELTAKLEIEETGWMETPVYLCGTHAVGTVYQAAVLASGRGPDDVVIPVVGECDDGDMADSRTVAAADVERALEQLGTEVAEGSVGAGTGMICFDFPGGIGTASRSVGDHHVGVLLLCNFGDREYLDLLGSRLDPAPAPDRRPRLLHRGLRDRRAALRAGSCAAWRCARCSGSRAPGRTRRTAPARSASPSAPRSERPRRPSELNPYFAAAYEAAHEAVYNCLVAARPAERLDGTMQDAFPTEAVSRLLQAQEGSTP